MAKSRLNLLRKAIVKEQKRPKKSRAIDESKTAKVVHKYPVKSWFKNPATSDIENIDTKKHKAQHINEVIGFLKGTNRFNKHNFTNTNVTTRRLVKITKQDRKALLKTARIRFSNVSLQKRKKKKTPNQYWVKIKR